MTLKEQYEQLLIKQYWDQPNARAEVALKADFALSIKTFLDNLANSFDLDVAVDDRLDKIGKLVGISRNIPLSVPKVLFGFAGYPATKGFSSKTDPLQQGAPFRSKFEPNYTDSQLNNNDFRKLIKAKIAKNTVRAFMAGEGSLQYVINVLFDGQGRAFDNYDMTLNLQLPYSYDAILFNAIKTLDLLPRPNGVKYRTIYKSSPESFAFRGYAGRGFSSKTTGRAGGPFARKII